MSKITPELSKQVGWEQRRLSYPTLKEIDEANDYKLLEWWRHLPVAENDEERIKIKKIQLKLS